MTKPKNKPTLQFPKSKKPGRSPHARLLALSGILVPILVIFGAYLGRYALTGHTEIFDRPPLKFLVSMPEYFSANEDGEIRVRAENLNSKVISMTLRASIIDNLMTFVGQDGTNILYTGHLQGYEQISSKLNVFLPYDFVFLYSSNPGQAVNVLGQSGKFTLQGNVDGQDMLPLEMPIQVSPIPIHKKVFAVTVPIFGTFIIWLLKEWWDQLKEDRKK